MRGNNVMKGYYEDPEATAQAFAGGWFHSGDLGVMHPDGYIELRDRKKDIIISGGENISTIEVEHTVVQAPGRARVRGGRRCRTRSGARCRRPSSRCGPGRGHARQELIDFCREHLAHFKCPKSIEFGELPKTSTGKIQKFVLREKAWAGTGRRIQ